MSILGHMTAWKRRGIAAALLVLVEALLVAWWSPSFAMFPIDDPYIHMVYARSLAHGHPLEFNPGERSLGTSSPLWMGIVSLLFLVDPDPVRLLVAVNFLLLCAWAFVVYLIVDAELEALALSPLPRLLAPVLAAVSVLFSGQAQWMACSGMEAMLDGLLVFLAVHVQCRRGLGRSAAALLGLALWTRVTSAALVGISWLRELAARRRLDASLLGSAGLTLLVYLPWLAVSLLVAGTLLPTTVGGKTATFVPGHPDVGLAAQFVYYFFLFLRSAPVYQVLVPATLAVGLYHAGRCAWDAAHGRSVALSAPAVLAIWSVVHLALFALTFRTFLHYGRYLMPISFAATVIVSTFPFRLRGSRPAWTGLVLLLVVCGVNASRLPSWRRLYRDDLAHMADVHIAAARWVRESTPPDSVIAAFDIGALGYIGGRRVVDLFGLLDPESHPYLRRHQAGEYLRSKDPDYILYLQDPNTDIHTRLYLAEYGRRSLLDQRFVTAFRSAPYDQPTVSQSFAIEVYEVRAWHDRTPAGRRAQFVLAPGERPPPLPGAADMPGVRFLGCEVVAPERDGRFILQRILNVPTLGLRMTCFWQKLEASRGAPRIRMTLSGLEPLVPDHPIAFGLVSDVWSAGEIAREPHNVWLDPDTPPGDYELRVEVPSDGNPIQGAPAALITVLPRTRDEL